MKNKIKQLMQAHHINKKKIWVYGVHASLAALENPDRVIYEIRVIDAVRGKIESLAYERGIKLHIVDNNSLNKLLHHHSHQGIALCCDPKKTERKISEETMEDHNRVVLLDQLTDVNNIGSIMRSMLAMNFTALVTTKYSAPDLEKCSIKSACGAAEQIEFFEVTNLVNAINNLKKLGFWVIGLDHRAPIITGKFPERKVALVVGSEGEGIRSLVLKNCDELVCLKVNPDFPVLNASIACAICMYVINSEG